MIFKPKKLSRRKFLVLLWTCAIFIICTILGVDESSLFDSKKASLSFNDWTPSEVRSKDKIRVCIWNLKLYLDTYKMTSKGRIKAPKTEDEKRAIVTVLKQINPDVLGVEEIGTDKFLKEFLKILHKNGLSYPYFAYAEKNDEYPHCAILSKIPIQSASVKGAEFFQYFDGQSRSPRALLLAEFKTNNKTWFFGSLHLKSRFGSKKKDKDFSKYRSLECIQISKDLSKILKRNSPIIIGGDFNDTPQDESIKILKDIGFFVLESENKIPTYTWEKKNISYVFDFFMASKSMLNYVENTKVFETSKGASDHLPVYCDLDFSNN